MMAEFTVGARIKVSHGPQRGPDGRKCWGDIATIEEVAWGCFRAECSCGWSFVDSQKAGYTFID